MKNKIVKRLIIAVIVIAVAGGCVGGGIYYRRNNLTAEVTSVEDIRDGYWGDEVYSYGQVTNDHSQTVYLSTEDTIKEVYVEEGQEVQAGDKLLAYDMTASDLDYNMKVLEAEKLGNQLEIAKNDLKKLKNTKPISPQVYTEPEPEQEQEPQIPEKNGDAYNYISPSAVPYNEAEADGTAESPYRYLCTAEAYVTGEALAALAQNGTCAVYEIYENNQVSGDPVKSWEVDGSKTTVPDPDTKWAVATRTQVTEAEEEIEDIPEEPVQEEEIGYTKEELQSMIEEKEQEIRDLDLSKRKAELEVEKLKQKSTDGIVYASVTGTVKNLQDIENPPTDGTPFLEVSGSEGLYVTGALSELLLDEIQPGQPVQISSWESGVMCEGEITEIFDYPVANANAYGEGNQNVSYYPYTAYIEDTSGLKNGEYVDLTMTVGGSEAEETLYISKAYVRTENGKSYVYKADENNRLVKQYVETGKTIYGSSVEIKSGLTSEDRIAFPYGKTAKEGIRAVDSNDEM